MTYSSLASRRGDTVKKSSRLGVPIDTFQIHHGATTDRDWMWNVMTGPGGRTVSSNYIITNEGEIWGVVPEEYRAWTSGSPEWDRRSITIEIENETGAPDWDISQRALQASANLLADVRGRHGIENVLGHRDLFELYGASYPTYCPGPNTVSQILSLAPTSGGGGSNEEDVMNKEQEAKLDKLLAIATQRGGPHNETIPETIFRGIRRQGGSVKQKSITGTVSEARDAANWLKRRVRGSNKDGNPSITAMLEAILEAVADSDPSVMRAVTARAQEIDLSIEDDELPEYEDDSEIDEM